MLADIAHGHTDLADWLLLIAFIVFVVDVVLSYVGTRPLRLALKAIGLALIALALMVL